ncbi:hypothetical protein [uncultured Thiodictyon sp.]|jgi:hypothetical protein|uniref:hypothetical protein n=1 Tax=uncultured Thiodictyon sp. TaxID=1846217 RepID=UPI0025DBD7CA|nr:hypothetical protein [uncultured Thiodictyon sp.]
MTENPAANPDASHATDYDSPWKEAIDAWLPPFMALFFPSVHALIDWDRPYEFLDAELQRITGDSTIGRRYADRLVKVYSREGLEVWLLLHIEIQGQAEAGFPERMFQYWYRYRYGREDAIKLLRFIDWLIRLPRGLELALRQELAELEEQTKMSYVTSWERFAREEGLEQGRREGWQEGQQAGWQAGQQEGEAKALLRLLQAKFGPPTPDLVARVQAAEPDQIEAWLTRILTANSQHEVFDTH